MPHPPSTMALVLFAIIVAAFAGLALLRGRGRTRGYAGGGRWLTQGLVLSAQCAAPVFMGVAGMVAFCGYDGFLYGIGLVAGWTVALLWQPDPAGRGGLSLAALTGRFDSPRVRICAAIALQAPLLLWLAAQLVAAGAALTALGVPALAGGGGVAGPQAVGILIGGLALGVLAMVAGRAAAGTVAIKCLVLLAIGGALTAIVLQRGLTTRPDSPGFREPRFIALLNDEYLQTHRLRKLPEFDGVKGRQYVRLVDEAGLETVWRRLPIAGWRLLDTAVIEAQYRTRRQGREIVNGMWPEEESDGGAWFTVGNLRLMARDQKGESGPLGPTGFLAALLEGTFYVWKPDRASVEGQTYELYYPRTTGGGTVLSPGGSPALTGLAWGQFSARLEFVSLLAALLGGGGIIALAVFRSPRRRDDGDHRAMLVAIVMLALLSVMGLLTGLGAMSGGILDPTDGNLAVGLLARSAGDIPLALLSAAVFALAVGAGWRLIDVLARRGIRRQRLGKGLTVLAVVGLALACRHMDIVVLLGWACHVAASALLPALVLARYLKRATAQGLGAAIGMGLVTSVAWLLLGGDAFEGLYGLDRSASLMPMDQPSLVTVPLALVTGILVSLGGEKPGTG